MAGYLTEVLNASGGAAAPEEVLETLDNPCWDGYVMIGMKQGEDGNPVPNCVPAKAAQALEELSSVLTLEELEEVLSVYNSTVGVQRHVPLEAAAVVASRALKAYADTCEGVELSNAVLWDTHSFLEYATLGTSEDADSLSEYTDLLAEGHPNSVLVASVEARTTWLAGAPDLDSSTANALKVVLSSEANPVELLHASTRIKALISSGAITAQTAQLIDLALDANSSY